MNNKIIINSTATANRIPGATELEYGELVLNYKDKAIYYKTADGLIDSFSSDTRIQPSIGSFTWNAATLTPNSIQFQAGVQRVTKTHLGMRRCLVLDNGQVNYYLDPTNSNRKENGQPSVLTGADGQVMVEIPKFYTKRELMGTLTTWMISDQPVQGFSLHPAFIVDGVEVPYRYYGAYDACVYDASATAYVDGLNLDIADTLYTYTEDKLSSVAGRYPTVGILRSHARQMAANRGAGWRQLDFWLVEAVQMLYLVEYQSFYSQNILGAGNTNGSYLGSSGIQTDSPHTIAGASNLLGNTSSNTVTGAAVNSKPGTAFMSYRGIENFFGNCWNWVDGFNILDQQAYVTNTRNYFVDDTSTNLIMLGTRMPQTSAYVREHQNIDNAFLPASVSAASSTTGWTDYYFQASGWRVAFFGGNASIGASAGAFFWNLNYSSSYRYRMVGARIAR